MACSRDGFRVRQEDTTKREEKVSAGQKQETGRKSRTLCRLFEPKRAERCWRLAELTPVQAGRTAPIPAPLRHGAVAVVSLTLTYRLELVRRRRFLAPAIEMLHSLGLESETPRDTGHGTLALRRQPRASARNG